MAKGLDIFTLGGLRITLDGQPVAGLTSRKARTLLVYLAYVETPQPRQALAHLLWEGTDTRQLLANLRRELAELRQSLPAYIELIDDAVVFKPDQPFYLDALELRQRLDTGETQQINGGFRYAEAVQLERSLEIYRAEFLSGLEAYGSRKFESWLLGERRQLHHRVVAALVHVVDCYLESGASRDATRLATRLLNLSSLPETIQRHLLNLVAEPFTGRASGAPYTDTPANGANVGVEAHAKPPVLLPAQAAPFIGREREVAELSQLLADPTIRLVSLVGLGGTGKTRLAIQAASEQVDCFADGIYFVNLAPLSAPDLVQTAVAETVGFRFLEVTDPRRQLLDFFREKSLLLLMDNFEHVLVASDLLKDIIQVAPAVKILTTSRERLNVEGERLFPVDGMDYPDDDDIFIFQDTLNFSAIKLFVQSVQRLDPNFVPQPDDLIHLARICHQVQGLPLGIVLAAAWANTLSLAEISEEIGRSLEFLETEAHSVPLRQRSLRVVFDHTWNMLNADEQAVFSGLAVFRGGFTREAVQAVTGATLKTLASLVNKSLIRRNPDGRYEIHELVRQYAEARLAESPTEFEVARQQHCAYFSDLMGRQESRLKGAEDKEALAVIEADLDNVRAAWEYALVAKHFDAIEQAAEALGLFFFVKTDHFVESEQLFQKACDCLRPYAMSRPLRLLLGRLLAISAYHTKFNFHAEAGTAAFNEADVLLQANDAPYEQAVLHLWWAMTRTVNMGWDTPTGLEWQTLTEQVQHNPDLFEARGDTWRTAIAHWTLADIWFSLHEFAKAEGAAQRALALFQQLGTDYWQIWPLRTLSDIAEMRHEFKASIEYNQHIAALSQEFGDNSRTAEKLRDLGYSYGRKGDYPQAKIHLEMCLTLNQRTGNRFEIARAYSNLGYVAALNHVHAEAYLYYQQALRLFRELGRPNDVANQLNNLASVAIGQGHYALAEAHCREALSMLSSSQVRPTRRIESLFHVGFLIAKAREPLLCVRILMKGLATLHDLSHTADVFPVTYEQGLVLGRGYLSQVQAELSPEAFAAAQEAAQSLNLDQLVAEILASPPLFPETANVR